MQYNKETYLQWWKFLKLSPAYHSLCNIITEARNDDPHIPIETLLNVCRKVISPKEGSAASRKLECLCAVYEKFGDVHRNDFETWWKAFHSPKSVKTKEKFEEDEKQKYKLSKTATGFDRMLRNEVAEFPTEYVPVYVNIHSSINDIKSEIGSIIKELKKRAKTNQREVIERDQYLDILQLTQEGFTMRQIIQKFGKKKERESAGDNDTQRPYRDRLRKARMILSNVEKGRFP